MKITICGLAWSWTSTLWKTLAEKLEYPFISTWNIMRSWAEESWYTIYDFEDKVIKKDKSFDIKLDKRVKDFWEKNNDFIFESRLAWNFIPQSFKIFLYCEDDERYNRIQKREDWFLDEIVVKTQKRESGLIIRYKEVYKNINFPPKKEDFDLFIDWTNITAKKTLDIVIKTLKNENSYNSNIYR